MSQQPRFSVGDRVRVLADNRTGNPRTPRYVRGRAGRVVAVHGVIDNPLDHRDPYPPLYTVIFAIEELTGRGGREEVSLELHEDWLEPANVPASQ